MKESVYFEQADLLIQILPFIHAEKCFALKGGTAINFFVRDFPRLSVDIDLVYLPIEDRPSTLRAIDAALRRIAVKARRALGVQVLEHSLRNDDRVCKLSVRTPNGAEVKVEPNLVLRGWIFEPSGRTLVEAAVDYFNRSVTMRVVSIAELYGGKICAALDRQHPRDLFDIHLMFQHEGLTDKVRRAFIVFLASHDRPMNELLTPRRKDLTRIYTDHFRGMTMHPASQSLLEETREQLIEKINGEMSDSERQFLISLKRLEPKWDLLGLPGLERLPGLQWKLYNLRRMDPKNGRMQRRTFGESLASESEFFLTRKPL